MPASEEELREIAELKALIHGSPPPKAGTIALPPGLFERHAGKFMSCFLLEADGGFKLKWSDAGKGTWLQGAGRATEIVETLEGRTLKYEIKLRGDFACAVPEGSDAKEVELPQGFDAAAASKAKKSPAKKTSPTKKGTGGGGKGGKKKNSARPKNASPEKKDGGAAAKVVIMEMRDEPYVIQEQIACPAEAGETAEEMRAWIAQIAKGELDDDAGKQRALEFSVPGYPFNLSSSDEPLAEEEEEAASPPA